MKPAPSPPTSLSRDEVLYRFSLFLVLATFLLILAGGLVTSHEAGLAVPDWPTSYGQWFPPMVGNVFWEHGHRMIAGTVGLLTLVLAIAIQIKEKRVWLKQLGWIAFAAVITQAILGGLTVIYMLPAPVSIAHACLAQTFFCLVVALAYFLKNVKNGDGSIFRYRKIEPSPFFNLRPLALTTAVLVYFQLILGATVRHTGHAIVPHIVVALVVVISILILAVKTGHRVGLGLGFLTLVQISLGLGAFVFTRMLERGYAPSSGEVFFTAAHQSTGALILAGAVLINLMAWK